MNLMKLPDRKQTPILLLIVGSLIIAGVIFWANQNTSTVSANFTDIALAENTYPNMVGSRIDTCVLCHTSSLPVLNPFGAAYKAGGRGSASALKKLNSVDTDGDGFTNLEEIKASTFPGDPVEVPQASLPMAASVVPTDAYPYPTSPSNPTPTQGAYPPPATPTGIAPTATQVAATATGAAPTATGVAPTATGVLPTATPVGPTATKVAPTSTRVLPTTALTLTTQPTFVRTGTRTGDGTTRPRRPR